MTERIDDRPEIILPDGRTPLQRWLKEGYENTCALPRRKTPQRQLRGSLLELAGADIEHDPHEEPTIPEINRLATSDPEAAAEAARPANDLIPTVFTAERGAAWQIGYPERGPQNTDGETS